MIEYDGAGTVVLKWEAADYFRNSDFSSIKISEAVNNVGIFDTHANSFYFDEKDRVIYVGFKNISRIIKIKYPQGTLLYEFGERYSPGRNMAENDLFCNQHACRLAADGGLLIFDNNGCEHGGRAPVIRKISVPVLKQEQPVKVWDFTCPVDDYKNMRFPFGGNVMELPDRSLFVCMGSNYSKVFIVSESKKIDWSAVPEATNPEDRQWRAVPQYRASVVTRNQLEQLVKGQPAAKAQRK